MMARFYDIHPVNPQARLVRQVCDILRDGGLMVYPTDSGFALGACLGNVDAKERIARIRDLDSKHHYTLVCRDFAQLGQYVMLDNAVFRAVNNATPGPYTFILPASREVPRKLAHPKKKTVGVRLPEHAVVQALLGELGEPILSTTLLLPGREEPFTQGWEVKEELDNLVDVVVNGDDVVAEPTTVVDFSDGAPEVLRVGSGDPDRFL